MKVLLLSLFSILSFFAFSQNKIDGHYVDYFDSFLQLNTDSTFYFYHHFDIRSSWAKGTWKFQKDTIDLSILPVYDTFSVMHDNPVVSKDSLVLSSDDKAERLTEKEDLVVNGKIQVQDVAFCPQKLFYRDEKLYEVKNGHLVKWIYKASGIKKKKNPYWFYKTTN